MKLHKYLWLAIITSAISGYAQISITTKPNYDDYTKSDSTITWYFTDNNKFIISIAGDVVDVNTGNPIFCIHAKPENLNKEFSLKRFGPRQIESPIEGYLKVANNSNTIDELINNLNHYTPVQFKRGYGESITFINENDYAVWGVNRSPNYFEVKNRVQPNKVTKYNLEFNESVDGYDAKSDNIIVIKSYNSNGSGRSIGDVALIKPFTGERKQLFKSSSYITNYKSGITGKYWLFYPNNIYCNFLIYDFNKSKAIEVTPQKLPFLKDDYIVSAAITPNDELIVACGYSSEMNLVKDGEFNGGWKKAWERGNLGKLKFKLININDFSIIKEWESELPYNITFSKDGSYYLLTDPKKGPAKVYNTINGELVSTLTNPYLVERYKTDLKNFINDSIAKEAIRKDYELQLAEAKKRADKSMPEFNKYAVNLVNQLKLLGWQVRKEFTLNSDGTGFIDMPKFFVRTEDSLHFIISIVADKQAEASEWNADMGFPGKDKTFLFTTDLMEEPLHPDDFKVTYTPVFSGLANTWFRMKDIKLKYPLKQVQGKMYYLSIPKSKYNKDALAKLGFDIIEMNLFTTMYNEFAKLEAEKRAKLEAQRKKEKELELERMNKLINNFVTCGLCEGKGEINQRNNCSCCDGSGKILEMQSEFHKMSDKRVVRYTYTGTGKTIENVSYEPIGYYTNKSTYKPCNCCTSKSSQLTQCPKCKGKGKVVQ